MFPFNVTVTILKPSHLSKIYKRLISKEVRVRFAPSPTGFLHLGGLRTALYNYFFAKSHNGKNILRIEDTDLSRLVPSATENLIEDLAWCGIKYDEGPYFQSERREIYEKYAKQLVEQGDAYYCFCSDVRLNLIRKEALKFGQIPKYDNHCRNLTKEETEILKQTKPSCIRFKLSSNKDEFNDLISGPTAYDVAAFEGDPVILKSDGFPTYHLANVVDDHLMNITHVLRGCEWLISTSKHILLYRAFNWDCPQFGHIPLLLNKDGSKLSKRQHHVKVKDFRENGCSPTSLINFIVRLGGGFDIKTEKNIRIYSYEELIKMFDLSKIRSNSCQVDFDLLPLFQHAEILRTIETQNELPALVKKIQELVRSQFQSSVCETSLQLNDERVALILKNLKHRITSYKDLVSKDFYYLWFWENKWDDSYKIYNGALKEFYESIKTVNWKEEDLQELLKRFCKQQKHIKYAETMQMIRFAITGSKVGHGVLEILVSLSKEDVLFRLSKILEPKLDLQQTSN